MGKNADAIAKLAQPEHILDRSARRGVQDILAAPGTTAAGLYGLAGAAIEKVRTGDPWAETFLSKEGKQLIADSATSHAKSIQLSHNPKQVLRTGLHAAAEWYEWGGELAGVTNNPDGSIPLDEEVGGVLASAFVTLPFAPAKLISIPAKAAVKTATTHALNATTRVTTQQATMSASKRAALQAAKGALTAAEWSTPMTMGGKAAILPNAVVGTAMTDVARQLLDEPTLTGQVLGVDQYTVGSVKPMQGLPQKAEPEDVDNVGGEGFIGDGSGLVKGAAAVTGIGALAAIMRPQRLADTALGLTTRQFRDNWLSEGGIVIADVKKHLDQGQADNFADMQASITGQGGQVAVKRGYESGIVTADGKVTSVPWAAHETAYARLSNEKRKIHNEAVEALGELDDRASKQKITNFPQFTKTQLYQRARRGKNDPEVKQVIDMGRDINRKHNQADFEGGHIGAKERTRRDALNYSPQRFKDGRSVGEKIKDKFLPSASTRAVGRSTAGERMRQGNINAKRLEPMQGQAVYNKERTISRNIHAVQKMYVEVLADIPGSGVRRLKNKEVSKLSKEHVFEIKTGGKTTKYEVADPRSARALQSRPHASFPIADRVRKWFQHGTTGKLNQLFAPISAGYDAGLGMLSARSGKQVSGRLDQALREMGAPDQVRDILASVTRIPDTMMLLGEGYRQGRMGRKLEIDAKRMLEAAALDGNPIKMEAARLASKTFLESRYGLMHMHGHATHALAETMSDMDTLIPQQFMQRLRANPNYKWTAEQGSKWNHFFDNIRESYRMGFFSRNVAATKYVKGGDLTDADYKRLVRETREVATDPSKRGASDNLNKVMSTIPYGGVIAHSAAHLFAQTTNPAAWSVMTAIVAAKVTYESSMSQEGLDYINREIPSYEKISHMFIEHPRAAGEVFDHEKHLTAIPLGPEIGTTVHVAKVLFLGMVDKLNGTVGSGIDTPWYDEVLSAGADLFGLATPPILNLGTSALGFGQLNGIGAIMDGRPVFRERGSDLGIEQSRGIGQNSGWFTDRWADMMSSAWGNAGRTGADMSEIADSAMTKYDESFHDAAAQIFDAAKHGFVDKQRVTKVLFGDETIPTQRHVQGGDRAYEIDSAMRQIEEKLNAFMPQSIDGAVDADIPFSELVSELPNILQDQQLRAMAFYVGNYFNSPSHGPIMDEVSQLRLSHKRMQGNTKVKRDMRTQLLDAATRAIHDRYNLVLDNYGEFEGFMRREFDNPTWTLNKFAKAIDDELK